jgi:hypothetical protein
MKLARFELSLKPVLNCLKSLCMTASLLGLLACGKPVRNLGQFEPYVEAFEKASSSANHSVVVNFLEMKFGPLPSETLALCTLGVDVPLITVNQSLWQTLTEAQRQLVIFHELGHCVLKRAHQNIQGTGGRLKQSIMDAHPLDLTDYTTYRTDYLAELFNPSSGTSL